MQNRERDPRVDPQTKATATFARRARECLHGVRCAVYLDRPGYKTKRGGGWNEGMEYKGGTTESAEADKKTWDGGRIPEHQF